jgi:hypothetical protein
MITIESRLAPDDPEARGEGVRELNQRLKTARGVAELQAIAAEAAQRAQQANLESSLVVSYQTLAALATQRLQQLQAGSAPFTPAEDVHGPTP